MSPPRGLGLEAYLRPGGAAQRRLLRQMADGHARSKHGQELGAPSRAAYQQRVARHLRDAPLAFSVLDRDGRRRYRVADPSRNHAAWITPHKEHRSTFFQPRNGVAAYVRNQHRATPGERWTALDIDALRGRTAGRSPARSISSASRVGPSRQHER